MDSHLKAARQARKGLDRVRAELLQPAPQALDRCRLPLQVAIGCMEQLAAELASVRAVRGPQKAALGEELGQPAALPIELIDEQALRTELSDLRRNLTTVQELIGNAASFYEGCAGLLGTGPMLPSIDYSPALRLVSAPSKEPFVIHG